MTEFEPRNADDVRKVVEKRLKALRSGSGVDETVTVEWRGQQRPLEVISMPIKLLSYNPATHRVRAQRTLDPAKDKVLSDDPFGAKGQKYLHDLLRGDPADPSKTDPAFDALKDDLREHGQNDPGIITRSGVLINGNTRRAALSEIGEPDIRVGVLPEDAGFEDQQTVELSLQLRKDHRRDYSFMNSLLAIEERVQAGWAEDRILREFRIRKKTFERSRWILAAVQELIERSQVKGANGKPVSMRLVDFETHQGKLEELYRSYTALKAKAPADAEALREQRLLAIALDKSKTDVRLIEPDFAKKYMPALIRSNSKSAKSSGSRKTIPGTKVRPKGPGDEVKKLRELTTKVVRARATEQSPAAASPKAINSAAKQLAEVDDALDAGLDKAGKTNRIVKKRFAAADRVSDANENLELSITAVADARATGNFNPDDLDDELVTLRTSLIKLAQVTARSGEGDSPGLQWLRAVAGLP